MTIATLRNLDPTQSRCSRRRGRKAFVLIEVVLSMTILAIAGSVLMRSFLNSMEATRLVRDTSKAVFLAQSKLHDFELAYSNKVSADLGEFRGRFDQPGASDFYWRAVVQRDSDRHAYIITVWTDWGEPKNVRRRHSLRAAPPGGLMLKTMAPIGRINEDLVRGMNVEGRRRGDSRYENRRGRP